MNLYTQIRNGIYTWKIQVSGGCDTQSLIYKSNNDILPIPQGGGYANAAILFE